MKKVTALLLTVVLGASLLAGCGAKSSDNGATSDQQTTTTETTETTDATEVTDAEKSGKITVWAWDPNFNISIMNEAAKRYSEANPGVEIEVVEMAKADVEQKLHTTLAAQTTEGLPEIVLIEDYNGQKYLQSYPGSFADLTSEFNFADFAAYKTSVMTLEGKVYGVPFDSGVAGMFYRTDILEEAGFTAADLQDITWDQFIEIGKVVKEKTGKAFLGFDKTDGGIMRIMLQSAGQWYFDQEGKPALVGNAALKEAVTLYKAIVDSGIALPTSGWDEWVGSINNGEAATITSGVWIVGSIKAPADQSGKWAVAPVPRLSTVDSQNASNLGGSSWYVLDKSANRDIAIDFMKTVYGADNDFYQTILMNNGAVGTYLPAGTGDAYTKADEFFGGNAIYTDLSSWMSKIPSIDYGSYTYEADAAIMGQLEAVCAGTISVDEAIEAAQAQLENQIQ